MEDLYLFPEDLQIDPQYQTRLWRPTDAGIEDLAQSIIAVGQIETGVVVRGDEPHFYYLTIGHRRRQAIALINQWQDSKGLPLIKMRVRHDPVGDPLQKAIISNWGRDDFSPMDKAAIVSRLRKLKGWYGMDGLRRISAYLGVSVSMAQQAEKFLKLEPEAQAALHSGQITPQSAIDLINANELHAKAVLALAAKIEAETSNIKQGSMAIAGRIRRPSILGAIDALRTKEGKSGKVLDKRKTRGEIIKMLINLDEAGEIQYQKHFANGDRSIWIRIFCKWAQGSGSERDVIDAFNKMTKNTNPGTPTTSRAMGGRPLGSRDRFKRVDPRVKGKSLVIERNQVDI